MAFSATEAAFEGFRIARERPMTLVLWSLVYLGLTAVTFIIMFLLLGSELMSLANSAGAGADDPARVLAMTNKVQALNLVTLPLSLLTAAIFSAAVYRAVLRPTDSAFGYLRFGSDELRLILLYVVLGLLALLAIIALMIPLALLAGGVGFAAMGGSEGSVGAAVLFAVLCGIVFTCLAVWVCVRLSLAAPMTFAERKLRIFESWTATKGRFWSLLGAYLLAGVLAFLLLLVSLFVIAAIAVAIGAAIAAAASGGSPSGAGALTGVGLGGVLMILGIAVLGALYYAIMLAPAAVAYRELVGRDEAAVF